jgi:AraC family transcriptional regulator
MPDYLDRMERAVAYVESTLDRPFSLSEVAREAGMSAFHFSRTFRCATGENVSEYARKRRLTRAALASLLSGEATMVPRIEERGEANFVGVACDNTERRVRIPGNWSAFLRRMGEIEGAGDRSTYGIYRYDFSAEPSSVDEDFPFRYLSALEVPPSDRVEAPAGMEIWPIAAARYAVFAHRGLLRDLGLTYRYIYKTWFPRSSERFALAPMLERRAPDYPGDAPGAETEIWIPLEG